MTEERKEQRLIKRLYEIADQGDRASLAALRDGLRPDRVWGALRILTPYVDRGSDPARATRAENDALLLAGLFALHPERGSLSLPAALQRVSEAGSDSIEKRFETLLAAPRSDLDHHLRHAVSLVRGATSLLGLDWDRLYRDIRAWSYGSTRRRWARDFWAPRPDADETASARTDTASN